jgi:hypothetical protein
MLHCCILQLPLQWTAPGGPAGTATASGSPATAAAGPCSQAAAVAAAPTADPAQAQDHLQDLAAPHVPAALPGLLGGVRPAPRLNPTAALNRQLRQHPLASHHGRRRRHLGRRQTPGPATPRAATAPRQALNHAARALNHAARVRARENPLGPRLNRQGRQTLGTLLIRRIRRSRISPATSRFRLRREGSMPAWSRCHRCSGRARSSTR